MYFDLKAILYFCKLYNSIVKVTYCKYYCPFYKNVNRCPREIENF